MLHSLDQSYGHPLRPCPLEQTLPGLIFTRGFPYMTSTHILYFLPPLPLCPQNLYYISCICWPLSLLFCGRHILKALKPPNEKRAMGRKIRKELLLPTKSQSNGYCAAPRPAGGIHPGAAPPLLRSLHPHSRQVVKNVPKAKIQPDC